MKDRGLKGTITVAEENDESAIASKTITPVDLSTVGAAKRDICMTVAIEVGQQDLYSVPNGAARIICLWFEAAVAIAKKN